MRNFLAFIGAAVIVFLGLGWYLGWYQVTTQSTGPGQSRLQVDINRDKISQDIKRGAEGVQEALEKARQSNTTPAPESNKSGATLTAPKVESDRPNSPQSAAVQNRELIRSILLDGWLAPEKR
jgi:cytoskeletal protein RodZ